MPPPFGCRSRTVPKPDTLGAALVWALSRLGDFLFWVSRGSASGRIVQWMFVHMSFAIPVERLRETESLVAFHHPRPCHAVHVLLVAKRPYASLLDVPPHDTAFVIDLLGAVRSLVRELGLEAAGNRLIANGGAYLEARHLHFHLVADCAELTNAAPGPASPGGDH